MANKSNTVLYVGIAAGVLTVIGIVYLLMKGSGANSSKKSANANAKTAAQAAAQAKGTPGTSQQALEKAIQDALNTRLAAIVSNGGKNPDGSTPAKAPNSKLDANGNPKGSTVNANGDYIEKDDPTTLYNSHGDVIGDLDAENGYFVDSSGRTIAACDGTPIQKTDSYGNYQEPDGQWYDSSGIPITMNGDGTYIESGDANDVFNMNGDVVGTLDPDGLTYVNNSSGQQFVLTSGRLIGYASQINSYNPDGSVDYTDGATLSADGMTLEYPNGTLVETGGKQVAWYEAANGGDVHYAASGSTRGYSSKPRSLASGVSESPVDAFYNAAGSSITYATLQENNKRLIDNIIISGINSGYTAKQLSDFVKARTISNSFELDMTKMAVIQAIASGNKNQAMINAYNKILSDYSYVLSPYFQPNIPISESLSGDRKVTKK